MSIRFTGGKGVQLGLRLAETDVAFHAPDHDQTALDARLPVRPARSVIARAKAQRQPNLCATRKGVEGGPLCAARKIELRRQDANDRALVAVDGNTLAY